MLLHITKILKVLWGPEDRQNRCRQENDFFRDFHQSRDFFPQINFAYIPKQLATSAKSEPPHQNGSVRVYKVVHRHGTSTSTHKCLLLGFRQEKQVKQLTLRKGSCRFTWELCREVE